MRLVTSDLSNDRRAPAAGEFGSISRTIFDQDNNETTSRRREVLSDGTHLN
jgi:hypothetical protein